ncbi:MAG TPA: DUF4349 domain-containing protein [Blastocatellia bacterium]|nr:DUF4349 domain-containing protein [Blastocatellia bacterium]
MKLVLSISLTLAFICSGCQSADKSTALSNTSKPPLPAASPVTGSGDAEQYVGQAASAEAPPAQPQAVVAQARTEQFRVLEPQLSEPPATAPTDRKIIRNGEFAIETKTPTEDQRKLQFIAESLGGFVVTSEFKSSTGRTNESTTVYVILRVPSANFQKATDEIVKIGNRVLHQKTTGNDVTAEYIDLEARLRAKKALETQYFEIMKRASKISDVLEVQEKLTEVRTEIEQAEGRRRYLENQSALSTINVTLQSPAPLVAATQTGFWASVKNSFGDGVDVAVAIVLGIIHFVIVMLPVVVLILLPAGLIARFLWKRISWPRKEPIGIIPPTE